MHTGFIPFFFHSPLLLSSVNFQVNSFNSFQSQKPVHSFLLSLTPAIILEFFSIPTWEMRHPPLVNWAGSQWFSTRKGRSILRLIIILTSSQSSACWNAEEEWLFDLYVWSPFSFYPLYALCPFPWFCSFALHSENCMFSTSLTSPIS